MPADASTEAAFWAEVLSKQVSTHRGIATTPGTPKDRVDFLREAFGKAMQEEELLQRLVDNNLETLYTLGDELQKIVIKSLELTPERMKALKKVLTGTE